MILHCLFYIQFFTANRLWSRYITIKHPIINNKYSVLAVLHSYIKLTGLLTLFFLLSIEHAWHGVKIRKKYLRIIVFLTDIDRTSPGLLAWTTQTHAGHRHLRHVGGRLLSAMGDTGAQPVLLLQKGFIETLHIFLQEFLQQFYLLKVN